MNKTAELDAMTQTPYDDDFFASQSDGSYLGAKEVLPIVFALTGCQSVLDVGCGVGTWLAVAQEQGISDILGVDGPYVNPATLRIPGDRFLSADLQKPLELKRRFDLVISLEVAEHLGASAAETFVDNLARHGPVILFSAAIPGQGGTSHVNEQWPGYWAGKFAKRGYLFIDCIRDRIWNNTKIPVCYRQNAFLYVEQQFLNTSPVLALEVSRSKQLPASVVHPDLLAEVLSRPINTRRLLKETPMAVLRTITARTKRLLPK